jgi:hypothetical protein
MILFFQFGRLQRNGDGDSGAFGAGTAAYLKFSTEQYGAFAHTEEAHGLGILNLGSRNAATIIRDLHNNFVTLVL